MAAFGRNIVFAVLVLLAIVNFWAFLTPPLSLSPASKAISSIDGDLHSAAQQLDTIFASQWEEKGISPAPMAPQRLIARRMSLALCGTIPSLEELRQLEAVAEEDRLEWWLENLLEQDRCISYLAERLARTLVGVRWEPPAVYRRDLFTHWLRAQLKQDRPYDEMVRELLTCSGNSNEMPAVNFLTSTCDVVTFQGPDPAKAAGRVAQAFVGVNLECAECHDHPFDVWTQEDFHSLAAFFQQTSVSFTGLRDSPSFGPAKLDKPSALFDEELLPSFGPRRQRLAAWITAPENRAFPRTIVNRVWTFLMNRPLDGTFAEIPTNGAPNASLEFLVDDFVSHGYSLKRLIRVIVRSTPFRLASRLESEEGVTPEHFACFAAYPMVPLRAEQYAAAALQSGRLRPRGKDQSQWYRFFDSVHFSMFRNAYGDLGAMEFSATTTSVPQKLLTMNGTLVDEVTFRYPGNTSGALSLLNTEDTKAIELVYLCTLSRMPTEEEAEHFRGRLAGTQEEARRQVLANLHWALLNSTEFSWNH